MRYAFLLCPLLALGAVLGQDGTPSVAPAPHEPGKYPGSRPYTAPAPRTKLPVIPGVPPVDIANPDWVCRVAEWHRRAYVDLATAAGRTAVEKGILRSKALEEVSYWRYISFHTVPHDLPEAKGWVAYPNFRRDVVRFSRFWLNQMHFGIGVVPFNLVPGTDFLLYFDLREPDWQSVAWSTVARENRLFREPFVETLIAFALRELALLEQDPKTLAVEVVLDGTQLLRDTFEAKDQDGVGKSDAYWNLLFSRERFVLEEDLTPKVKKEPQRQQEWKPQRPNRPYVREDFERHENKTITHTGGPYTYPDDSERVVEANEDGSKPLRAGQYTLELWFDPKWKKQKPPPAPEMPAPRRHQYEDYSEPRIGKFRLVDFPANATEWIDTFEINTSKDRTTARAFGKKIEVKFGAVVLGHHDAVDGSAVGRNTRLVTFRDGKFGPNLVSFDVVEGTGEQDFVEQAPQFSKGIAPKSDANERLEGLPAGGQACFLNRKDLRRIAQAVGDVATGIAKVPRNEKRPFVFHANVRTPGDCFRCHAINYGVIDPDDFIKTVQQKYADLLARNPAESIAFEAFYAELTEQNEAYRVRYRRLLQKSTKWEGEVDWTGGKLVEVLETFWNWYDAPVGLKQAAVEVGVPEDELKAEIRKLPQLQPQIILEGGSIPRAVWEKDVRPKLLLRFVIRRQQATPVVPVAPPRPVDYKEKESWFLKP